MVVSASPDDAFDAIPQVLVPAVADACKVSLFPGGGDGSPIAGPGSDGYSSSDVWCERVDGDLDGGSHGTAPVLLTPDRLVVRFGAYPPTSFLERGFVTCRWNDGYRPSTADAACVQLLVDAVVERFDRAHVATELRAATEQVANLQAALGSNRRIGAAVGVLMARYRLTEKQAFERLANLSQVNNRKLNVIADYVVETGELPEPSSRPRPRRRPAGPDKR